jgi:O-antigen biosynthesis protein
VQLVLTSLRLANYLHDVDGVKQRFLICGAGTAKEMLAKIATAFPALAKSEVIILDSLAAMHKTPSADYAVATLWTTAYAVLKAKNIAFKFYMIQDYEPLFYPAGTTSAQAELTYRFGFYGITNTESLHQLYTRQFATKAVVLTPNIDTAVFYPGEKLSTNQTKRLFYYARPGTPRNNFELAIAALKKVKDQLGDKVEIICAGAAWNPVDFGLENIVNAVGMLPYNETGNLYRSCHVGLSMMMTPHPSYLPFEMMACSTLVVANYNEANRWFLKDQENCLISQPTVSCLSETLLDALLNYENYSALRIAAASTVRTNFGDWSTALKNVAQFMHQPQ